MGDVHYQIDSDKCTECVGHYDKPTCQAVCPIKNCIEKDPEHPESLQQLADKFVLLYPEL